MPLLILIPFGAFAICCALQFWFIKKVRDALIDRHPQTYLSIEKSSLFPSQALWRFTRGNVYKELEDEELNRHVRNLKRLQLLTLLVWACYGVSLVTFGIK